MEISKKELFLLARLIKHFRKYGARWILGLSMIFLSATQYNDDFQLFFVERLDTAFYDLRTKIQQPSRNQDIIILDIDEKSLSELGRWPWSRNVIADLVTKLFEKHHVRVVSFDVMFAEPDLSSGYATIEKLANNELKNIPDFKQTIQNLAPALDYDAKFTQVLKKYPVVLGYHLSNKQKKGGLPKPAFTEQDLNGRHLDASYWRGYEANLAPFQKEAKGGGFFNANVDPDGILRNYQLLARIDNSYYDSLALATARVALNAKAIKPIFNKSIDELSAAEKEYGGLDTIGIYAPKKLIKIPVGRNFSTLIQYRGPGGRYGGGFRYISASDVINNNPTVGSLENKIILVGSTAAGLNDLRATPVSNAYPGVEAHANVIASILNDNFKKRPDYAIAIEFLEIILISTILCMVLPTLSPFYSVLFTLGSIATITGVNIALYIWGDIVIRIATPLLLILFLFITNIVWGYLFEHRNRKAIVSLFGEYVSPELVTEMADHPEKYSMEGENKELTILFVDIRGFTTISEALPPKVLREYINTYLTALSEDIRNSRGTLDKYIGDAIMAFWGAPISLPDHAQRAVQTALKMLETSEALNKTFIQQNLPPLKIGIGLNTGNVHVGDMGSKTRRAYTVIGDPVNLACRLEGLTKIYGVKIIVGINTKLAVPDFYYRELDYVQVKGKNEPTPIFEPIGPLNTITPELRHITEEWHQAYHLIHQQKWDDAQRILETLRTEHPNEVLYSLYLKRIAHYRQFPPREDWNGVTTFDFK
jgi:adenylate cyclase